MTKSAEEVKANTHAKIRNICMALKDSSCNSIRLLDAYVATAPSIDRKHSRMHQANVMLIVAMWAEISDIMAST